MPGLHADIWGDRQKQTAILLHGSFAADPTAAWTQQRVLADRYRLVIPHRSGYGISRMPEGEKEAGGTSLAADVQAVAGLLEPKTHLVGFSYGGLIALLFAAEEPELVGSLAVIEPPLYGLLRGDVEAEELIGRLQPVYAAARHLPPEGFYYAFLQGLGQKVDPAVPLPCARLQAARAAAKEAVPWMESDIPIIITPSPRWQTLLEQPNSELTRDHFRLQPNRSERGTRRPPVQFANVEVLSSTLSRDKT